MKKKLLIFVNSLCFMFLMGTSALAISQNGTFPTTGAEINMNSLSGNINSGNTATQNSGTVQDSAMGINVSADIPVVTVDDATRYANRKGMQIVTGLQSIVKPIAEIAFIIFGICTIAGALSKSHLVGKGILAMIIAVLVYVAVQFAPEIMGFSYNFFRT